MACEPAPAHTAAPPPVVGTWRVADYWKSAADSAGSHRVRPFGDDPEGYVVYDRAGHFLMQVRRRSPATPRSLSIEDATPEQLREILGSYAGSFGTYQVDTLTATVRHRIEGEVPPLPGILEHAAPYRVLGDTLWLGDSTTGRWLLLRRSR